MSFKIVPADENETGEGLVSEVLGIPMIIRGEPSVRLLDDRRKFEPTWRGHALSEKIGVPALSKSQLTTSQRFGIPTLTKSGKGRAKLFNGTISERLGLPTILKGR